MIYDCFTFFNELDLLEIRLNILNDYVDKFVIVEATRTFNNKPKPLYFEQNKDRFEKFKDKIIHVIFDEYPEESELREWTIENSQRNYIMKGLENCNDDDIIMVSDMDEIPRPELIKSAYNPDKIVAFDMDYYIYFLNNLVIGRKWNHGTKLLSYKNCKSILDDYDASKTYAIDNNVNKGTTLSKIRLYYGKIQIHIKKAGLHFTCIGGIENLLTKFSAIRECEPIESIEEGMKRINSTQLYGKYYIIPVEIDETFPEHIRENIDKYSKFIATNGKKLNFWNGVVKYKLLYFLKNIFSIKKDIRFGTKRTILILFGIKMRIKKEKIDV